MFAPYFVCIAVYPEKYLEIRKFEEKDYISLCEGTPQALSTRQITSKWLSVLHNPFIFYLHLFTIGLTKTIETTVILAIVVVIVILSVTWVKLLFN